MQIRWIYLPLVFIAALTLLVAEKADPAQVMLEAARKKEVVDGDLNAAIQQYKTIASRYAGNRAVAAGALIRMADCYQKLGNAESGKIYEQVLRDYADQKEPVAIARVRLGRNAPARETGMVVRQIWAGEDVDIKGKPSADGRYLTFVDWKTIGNLAVRDITTGENRLLTRDASWDGFAANPVFSPDGRQIAYLWYGGKEPSLRLIAADGSRMRVLMTGRTYPYVQAWAPDGKQIAVNLHDYSDNTNQVALISVANGAATRLKSTGWRWPEIGGFSPDGRFLVYALPKSPSANDGGIFVIAADGSRETIAVRSEANDTSPVWTPDGRTVVFLSDRSGTKDLWSTRIVEGKSQGAPELVRANIGEIANMGFSRDGSYFYGARNQQRDVYVAGIDPETLSVTAQPARMTDRFVGSNSGPAWSPDGKWVAFLRGAEPTKMALVIRSLSTGEERTLPTKFADGLPAGRFGPNWFPDNRSLLVADNTNNRRLFRRIDIETGQERIVFDGSYRTWGLVRLSPDGKSLYYSINEKNGSGPENLRLMKRDIESGQESELYRAKSSGIGFFGLSLSPDGARLAFMANVGENQRTLMTLPTQGGTPHELYRGDYLHPNPFSGAWTKDGRHIVVAFVDGQAFRLVAIPAEGGEPRNLNITMQGIQGPVVSPDGRQIAFTGTRSKSEFWVIHNLLPELRAVR